MTALPRPSDGDLLDPHEQPGGPDAVGGAGTAPTGGLPTGGLPAEVGHAEVGHAEVGHAEVDHAEVGHAEVDHAEVDHAEVGRADGVRVTDAARLSTPLLEALLFVAERPLSRREIAALARVDSDTVDARLGDLEVELRDRGIRLVTSGEHVQLASAPEAGELLGRYTGAEGARLTPAALETLAIVAYRQPVTRAGIERVRGVDSDYVLRTLLHRRLVEEQGRADAPGRPILYGTGFAFLERFGLPSLDDLPPLDAELAGRLAATVAVEDDIATESGEAGTSDG